MTLVAERIAAVTVEDVKWARAESVRREMKLIELLEERLACDAAHFVARLAATVRMPAISLKELRAREPAFDCIPFAEASRRGCVALRSDGTPLVVVSDP